MRLALRSVESDHSLRIFSENIARRTRTWKFRGLNLTVTGPDGSSIPYLGLIVANIE